jgi:hypothetical protein
MYVMAALQGMAFLTNQLLKPVPQSLHENDEQQQQQSDVEKVDAIDAVAVEPQPKK